MDQNHDMELYSILPDGAGVFDARLNAMARKIGKDP